MLTLATLNIELHCTMKALQNFQTNKVMTDDIVRDVCFALEVSEVDIMGNNRKKDNTEARFIIFYLLKEHAHLGNKQIGDLIGGKHRTTVIYGIDTYQNLIDVKDKPFLSKLLKVQNQMPEIEFFNQ